MKNGDYELVVAPKDYTGTKYRGKYCSKHVLVYWQAYGVIPKKDEVVHHKDENKHNNDISNLELIKRSIHTSNHTLQRGRKLVELKCPFCGKLFIKEKNRTFLQNKKHKYTCCSQSCASKFHYLDSEEQAKRIAENVVRKFTDIKTRYLEK